MKKPGSTFEARTSRRRFLKSSGASLCAAGLTRSQSASSAQAAAEGERPNVLLILTDQQFAETLSCRIGKEFVHTPAMDRLADNGTLFEQAYCANPICVPSRTAMFTGRYPHETNVQSNIKSKLDPVEFPLMGKIFKDAGYDTGYCGKWHMPFHSDDEEGTGFEILEAPRTDGGKRRRRDPDKPAPVIDFIKREREKPFLAVASFMNPHNICQWARGEELPDGPIGEPPPPERCPPSLPNRLPPENETDAMAFMRESYQANRMFPVGDFSEEKWRQYRWAYFRMIELVDGQIGQILDALRENGLEENTLVVFLSDHGDCHGAHRWNQKTVFYDESSRVPFILSFKGVTKKGVSDKLLNTGLDLIPTLCDFAGVEIPEELPGLSAKGIALGNEPGSWREYVVVENHLVQGAPVDGESLAPQGRMVRSRRYKYCVYDHGENRESLIDMEDDPGEMNNVARSGKHKEILERHRERLAEHAQAYGDALAEDLLHSVR